MREINNSKLNCLPLSRLTLATVAALNLSMPLAAFAQTASMTTTLKSAPMMEMHKSMDMRKSMDNMHEKMSAMKMSGNSDIDFAMMMVIHHQGAIDMAQAELDAGKDPELIKAAKKIIAAQKKEIAQFEDWLKKHPHTMK